MSELNDTLASQVRSLEQRQLADWPLVHNNYAALDEVRMRKLYLEHSLIVLQYNPERRRSSAAQVDAASLAARPCFLCDKHQPKEQEKLEWGGGRYKIQVNPYPIFPRHLTISSTTHTPQSFVNSQCIDDMLSLAKELPDYVVFYNGPRCGASAPDHMHFQATLQCEMPLCAELEARKDDGLYSCYGSYNELWMDNRSGRQLIYARAKNIDSSVIWDMTLALRQWRRNALCWHKDGIWHFVWFPRTHSRPKCYGDGEGQFLISPAAAEYGGVWVLPRKEDFERLNTEVISAIYKELSCCDDEMRFIYDSYVRVN